MTANSSGIASHTARSVRLTPVKTKLSALISNGRVVVVRVNRADVKGKSGKDQRCFFLARSSGRPQAAAKHKFASCVNKKAIMFLK